ncbi:type I-F CRISPR-associated protein Csy2 [Zestomonas carbonaria]|uniref:CRISPR-associated protein Csy2 n=1 Tax=Zestomonas carbonaria TaxID=2762745 RepID=A0A7U7EKT4_9GAMM|nr:type I-F CRISPR-associated protein Csy2 [Pseudomonas carbonaria]CAD5106711.1 CRISPR-associated protein Csy2 [Pseudomonas carbonaria]
MHAPEALLLLPRLRVQNANAISGPLSWGFPAVTAFTGFVHALQRKLGEEMDINLDGVAIVCHRFEAQTSQPAGKRTRVFNLTRNPVGKDGATAAIVEEGRIHLDISLLVGVHGSALYSGEDLQTIAEHAWDLACGMRLAGGSVLPPTWALNGCNRPRLELWPGTADAEHHLSRKLAACLLPGFALIPRQDLLASHTAALRECDAGLDELDALLDLSRLNVDPPGEDIGWHIRHRAGWLVPIPVGYRSLSAHAPGSVRNARDRTTPFHFVESLYSLGEWRSPHRFSDIRELLWYHQAEPDAGLYRCTTPFLATDSIA